MRRRRLLKSIVAAGVAGSSNVLWAPGAMATTHNAGHNSYFSALNEMLKRDGPGHPVMLIDTARMTHNISRITQSVGDQKRYRVVVKSLPSVPLLREVMEKARTQSLMVFHQPFLNAVAQAFPLSDVLLGKPMPIRAVQRFYSELDHKKYNAEKNVQWLVDSKQRLLQYQAFARQYGLRLGVNFEIDVGLHRGGLAQPELLSECLAIIAADDEHLHFTGLMGYEPQLTGLKADLSHPAVVEVLSIYRGFIDRAKLAGYDAEKLVLNGAGSHTLKIYEKDNTMNDLSAGSGVVMPTDFDTFHLTDHQPALFIAAPILKRYQQNPFMEKPPTGMEQVYYIYGGYWKANMVSPQPVGEPIYQSTNQSPILASADLNLQVDDYMFFRPTQSEFVMLQFGDLLAVTDERISHQWPVFQQTG
ncbi:MAG: alanine racemase [Pseudomonadales bacterium]|jgi:D-serine deaminase-like pyridoxal phosphate-dependent protein|nr:alanine racemase [Pseudomonadales bacterium]